MGRKHLYPPSVRHGIPHLGPLPRGWIKTTFGEQLRVVERPLELRPEATYQLVTAKRNRGGIVARETLRGDQILTAGQFQVAAGDFITSNRQIIHGACGLVPRELDGAIVSGEYTVMHARSGLHLPFFAHYTHGDYFQKSCFFASVGVDVEKMIFDVDQWLKLSFHLPPISEQRRIATVLADIDAAIDSSKAVFAKKLELKRGLVARLFQCGLDQHGRIKTRGRPKQTPIGLISDGWKLVRVRDAGEVRLGRQRAPDQHSGKHRTPYLRVANVLDGIIDYSDVLSMDFTQEERPIFFLRKGDILLNEGQSLNLVGRSALFTGEPKTYCFQNSLIRFRAGPDCLPQFAQTVFKQYLDKGLFQSVALQTTSIAHLGADRLASMWFPLPPVEEQQKIVEQLNHWNLVLDSEEQKLASLHRTKSELARRLLTGELRVKQ
jgi:type I restriction enzyme, S subunit